MLANNHITLRKITILDSHALVVNANNKRIWDNLRAEYPNPYTIEDAREFILSKDDDDFQISLAIDYRNKLIGIISIRIQEEPGDNSGEISYWIGERFWLKGFGTTAVELMTLYGFEVLRLHKLYARVFEYNIGAMIVLEKNGYKKEGLLEDDYFKNGKYVNTVVYGKINNLLY